MKQFRWILLSGLLVAATSVAQAQAPGADPNAPTGAAGAGDITNAPTTSTTTTTTTTGVAPDAAPILVDEAVMSDDAGMSPTPNTGGEPMIAVLAGLSIAGAAVAMRRKVAA